MMPVVKINTYTFVSSDCIRSRLLRRALSQLPPIIMVFSAVDDEDNGWVGWDNNNSATIKETNKTHPHARTTKPCNRLDPILTNFFNVSAPSSTSCTERLPLSMFHLGYYAHLLFLCKYEAGELILFLFVALKVR